MDTHWPFFFSKLFSLFLSLKLFKHLISRFKVLVKTWLLAPSLKHANVTKQQMPQFDSVLALLQETIHHVAPFSWCSCTDLVARGRHCLRNGHLTHHPTVALITTAHECCTRQPTAAGWLWTEFVLWPLLTAKTQNSGLLMFIDITQSMVSIQKVFKHKVW